MTERTIYLDPDPRDWRSRKLLVRAFRWYATVVLDRDGYVDASISRGNDPELPTAFIEAADRARDVLIERIWCDGYPGNFSYGSGARRVTLFVQFPHVEAAVEALRSAEVDRDYSGLHTLADRLALPIDDWLAPGERELIRGIDFGSTPAAFLRFLRAKGKAAGLRLNGRATAGSVWIRPTLPPTVRQIRETFPEQYSGWVDRWTAYIQPDEAPMRPWAGGTDRDLSNGATPVTFRAVKTPTHDECPCGMRLRDLLDGDKAHTNHHTAWTFGIQVPKNLEWRADLAIVTTQSSIAWRKLAYRVARLPQKENHYDFRSWSHLSEPEKAPDNYRAYLLKTNGHVIGYLAAHDTSEHYYCELNDSSEYGDEDNALRPRINLVWVANAYRRLGVGATLVKALADDFGCQAADVSWSAPISNAGQHLARRVSPKGVWIS